MKHVRVFETGHKRRIYEATTIAENFMKQIPAEDIKSVQFLAQPDPPTYFGVVCYAYEDEEEVPSEV